MKRQQIYHLLILLVFSLSAAPTYTQKVLTLKKTKDFSNGTADEHTFSYLRDIFDTPVFFETGTYNGLSAVKFAKIFSQLYTVELSDSLYEEANDRLRHYTNVCNKKDDSSIFLQQMIPVALGKKCIFLDAHGCGGKSAAGHPIIKELNVLKQVGIANNIIIIDDARGLKLEGDISLKSIYRLLKEIDPAFTIVSYSDTIIAYHDENIIPSDVVRACTTSIFFDPNNDAVHDVLKAEKIIAQATGEEQRAILRLTFPETALYHVWRGLIHLYHQEYNTAEKLFNLAIKKGHNHTRIHRYLKAAQNKENYFLTSA